MNPIPPAADTRSALLELKADYFFCVDNKLWDRLLTLFTPDATFRGTGFRVEDPAGFVAKTAEIFTGVHSSHFGFQPVFSIDDEGAEARGRWTVQDFLTWDSEQTSLPGITTAGAHSFHGFGYYEDLYKYDGDRWKIHSMKLIRTRFDVVTTDVKVHTFDTTRIVDPAWAKPTAD